MLLSGGNPLATTGDVLQRWKKKSSTLKSRNKNINLDFSDEEDMDAGYVINVKPNDDLCDDNDCYSHTKETWSVSISRDQEGNKLVNEYIILKTLGSGSYGKVKLCMNSLELKFYAIKICHKGVLRRRRIGMSTALQDVVREIAIMKKLDHKNVVKLYEIINDSEHEKIYMVMEYISGGPILKLNDKSPSEPLPLETARSYFRDIISGVEYLHKQKIIHRDIKPENLLVTEDGVVKITDFSVSHVFVNEDDTLSRSAGSPAFLAPELCTAGAVVAGKPVDVWACGVSLYALIYGHVPFTADNLLDIYEAIRNDEVKFPPEIPIPDDLKDLLLQILDKNPSTRIKIPAIKKHPWVTDNGAFQFPDKIETIEVSPSEVQNAITNNFMALVRFKSRMSQLSNMAKKNILERCSQINFGGSPLSLSDISDSDTTSSASASESSHHNRHQDPENELSVPVTDAEMREFTQNNPDFLQFQPL